MFLHTVVKKIQLKFPLILPDSVIIEDVFSVFPSLRRDSNTEARNAKMPRDIANPSMKWRYVLSKKGLISSLSLVKRYICSIAQAYVPTLIRILALLPMNK